VAYTADSARITAAMAHAGASATKTAFATDLATLQTQIQTKASKYSEHVACILDQRLMALASEIASAIKDVTT
jgi:hypothetical protein